MFAPVQVQVAKIAAPTSRLSNFGDKDVPAYTIFALSVFLKLDYYAIALVTCDRFQAKRVLRAAMGIANTEREIDEIMANFAPIMPKVSSVNTGPSLSPFSERKSGLVGTAMQERGIDVDIKSETDNLTIYPFNVLERIWTLSGPKRCPKHLAEELRRKKDTLSVLDVILLCASRFSNTSARAQTTFSPSSDAQAIDQIFQLSDQIDSLRESMATTSNPQKPTNSNASMIQQMMIMDGAPSSSQNANNGGQGYWAKGTGFGSGTTSVQWNLNEHVRKRKLNEEAVTCMINTVSGFLMPSRDDDMTLTIKESNIGLVLSQIAFDKAASFHKDVLLPDEQFTFGYDVISRIFNSCLISIIHSYLTNDSVFDISKHLGIYEACIWFIITLASLKPIIASKEERQMLAGNPDNEDILAAMLLEPCAGETIYTHVNKMHSMIKQYLLTIEKERNVKSTTIVIEDVDEKKKEQTMDEVQEEENLEMLEGLLHKAKEVLDKRLGMSKSSVEEMDVDETGKDRKENLTFEELYSLEMKPMQYESIPFMADENKLIIPHHFSSQFLNSKVIGNPKRMRRLARKFHYLKTKIRTDLNYFQKKPLH